MPLSDANLPPMTPSELPSSPSNPLKDPEEGGSGMLTLDPEQLKSLGLGDCQPGDQYTITLTKSDSADGEGMFEVDDVQPSEGEGSPGEAPGNADEEDESTETPALGGLNASPDDMSATPPVPGEESGDDEVGYARKKKKARQGLPDTKKMRE